MASLERSPLLARHDIPVPHEQQPETPRAAAQPTRQSGRDGVLTRMSETPRPARHAAARSTTLRASLDALHLNMTPSHPAGLRTHVLPALDKVLEGMVIDGRTLTRTGAGGAVEGASSQAADHSLGPDGQHYRVKHNAGRAAVTFHEVFAGRLSEALGFNHAPRASLIAHRPDSNGRAEGVRIASSLVVGFRDLGQFLQRDGLSHVPANLKQAYATRLAEHQAAQGAVQAALAEPDVKALLQKHPKGGFSKLGPAEHRTMQALRDAHRRALQAEDQMLELLPSEFRSQLLHAFYASEVLGNWDFMNHERANTGFAFENGKPRCFTVDYGNSGPIGFGGRRTEDSLACANEPARIDDPYAGAVERSGAQPYMQGLLRAEDVANTAVSKTFSSLGQLPRSTVFADLLGATVVAEREHADGLKRRPPDEALEVAWRLQHLPADTVKNFARAFYAQGEKSDDPAIRELFESRTTGFAGPDALAAMYQSRIDAIVARANQDGVLASWAQRNPERARLNA